MPRKVSPEKQPSLLPSTSLTPSKLGAGKSPFEGASVVTSRLPSGVKLVMDTDADAILVFIGHKDISDRMGKEAGEVVYNVFFDGKVFVNMPMSYSFHEIKWEVDVFYYVHNAGAIECKPGFNAMKDFEVYRLGKEGEALKCTDRIHPDKQITLTLPAIAEANYSRLNYPLRG